MLNSKEMQPPDAGSRVDGYELTSSGLQQAALFPETPAEIYARIFHELKPGAAVPEIRVEFRRYANANSSILLESGMLTVRIADVLEGAPASIVEALAYVLLGKLYRRPIPGIHGRRYRLYLNRREFRQKLQLIRQIRGRKLVSGPEGANFNLE